MAANPAFLLNDLSNKMDLAPQNMYLKINITNVWQFGGALQKGCVGQKWQKSKIWYEKQFVLAHIWVSTGGEHCGMVGGGRCVDIIILGTISNWHWQI